MTRVLSIQNLIQVIRDHQRISPQIAISDDTLLEADLGITGDDGDELLESIEREFGLSFVGTDGTLREAFALKDDEYLFHSEGFGFFAFIASLFGKDLEKIKSLTVGQLYDVLLAIKNNIVRGNL